jgi:hypothetical protein
MNYIMNNGNTNVNTNHSFKTYDTSNTQTTPLQITSASTRVNNIIDVGTQGAGSTSFFRTAVQMMDMNSPYSNFNQIVTASQMALYNMTGTMTQHRFATYNAVPAQVVSLDIYSNQIVSRVPLTIMAGLSGPETQIVQSGDDFVINTAQASASTYFKFNNTTSVQMSSASTKILNSLESGTSGVSGTGAFFKSGATIYDTSSPYTTFLEMYPGGSGMNYIMNGAGTGVNTSHSFKTYSTTNTLSTPMQIASGAVSFNTRLSHTSTSYSFPLPFNQNQGFYFKTTGTAQAVVSATPKTILTTGNIPIGVWRIDFSVINTITTGGTITQSQSFVSTTNNGAIATAIDFSGAVLRSHVSEVYATNDVQEIAGSFTYNQSTAGVLYLNILRTFSTGVYSFVGEVAITRIA